MHDVSDVAAKLGFRCKVVVLPGLHGCVEPVAALTSLRARLLCGRGDLSMANLLNASLSLTVISYRRRRGELPTPRELLSRARTETGEVISNDWMVAWPIAAAGDGIVPAVAMLWGDHQRIALGFVDEIERVLPVAGLPDRYVDPLSRKPMLTVTYLGKGHAIYKSEFVIGRRRDADLQIDDELISRRHAAVVFQDGMYRIEDRGSVHGVIHKGMKINGKSIEEGDVFLLLDHEITFTYVQPDR